MRAIPIVCAILTFVAAVPAQAQTVNAPAGNSGISQYVEVVPASSGNRPSKAATKSKADTAPSPAAPAVARGDVTRQGTDQDAANEPAEKATPKKSLTVAERRRLELEREGPVGRLLADFVAGTTPAADGSDIRIETSSAGSASAWAALLGDDAEIGMGRLLPMLMAALAVLALVALRRRGRAGGSGE